MMSFCGTTIPAEGSAERGVIEMEDPRCKVAAIEMEDSRLKGFRNGMEIVIEDLRCERLPSRVALQTEDPRCMHVVTVMEDPRCQWIQMKW